MTPFGTRCVTIRTNRRASAGQFRQPSAPALHFRGNRRRNLLKIRHSSHVESHRAWGRIRVVDSVAAGALEEEREMHPFRNRLIAVCAALASPCAAASAAAIYSDNFNTNTSANWTVNVAPTANASLQSAEFAYDYSTFGIPAAPGSSDTLGLRLRANIPGGAASPNTTRPAGVTSGLSVSPTGQNFGSNYQATFYAWSNFNGAATATPGTGLADNANSEGGTNN